jgi:hypothetical protein
MSDQLVALPDNTQHSQQTDRHAPDGIVTHSLSRRVAADPRLSTPGCWDHYRLLMYTVSSFFFFLSFFRLLSPPPCGSFSLEAF